MTKFLLSISMEILSIRAIFFTFFIKPQNLYLGAVSFHSWCVFFRVFHQFPFLQVEFETFFHYDLSLISSRLKKGKKLKNKNFFITLKQWGWFLWNLKFFGQHFNHILLKFFLKNETPIIEKFLGSLLIFMELYWRKYSKFCHLFFGPDILYKQRTSMINMYKQLWSIDWEVAPIKKKRKLSRDWLDLEFKDDLRKVGCIVSKGSSSLWEV